MGAGIKSWFGKVGFGIGIICALYGTLAGLSIWQIFVIRGASPEFDNPAFGWVVTADMVIIGFKALILLLSVSSLAKLHEPGSVWLATFAALPIWPLHGLAISLVGLFALGDYVDRVTKPVNAIDAAVMISILAYLLLSKKVALIYGTGSRRTIVASWRWVRGRHLIED